jgi:hypothetical protein
VDLTIACHLEINGSILAFRKTLKNYCSLHFHSLVITYDYGVLVQQLSTLFHWVFQLIGFIYDAGFFDVIFMVYLYSKLWGAHIVASYQICSGPCVWVYRG